MLSSWSATATAPATAPSPANGSISPSGNGTAKGTKAGVEAEVLLDGMLAKDRLLDLVENFILFDDSRPGGTRKIVARNHQVLGRQQRRCLRAVGRRNSSAEFPPERRLQYRVVEPTRLANSRSCEASPTCPTQPKLGLVDHSAQPPLPATDWRIIERAHPDLGRLGVFWHTQGSGKSYSMVMFAEKVRRHIRGNFTFVIATDREDLDDQIFRTFVGCGIADEKTPACSLRQGAEAAAEAESSLHLLPDPQVQPGRGPGRALQHP